MNRPVTAAAAFLLMTPACAPGAAHAADIKAMASGALKGTPPELLPDFQKSSGTTVTIVYSPGGDIAKRIQRGEVADVAIVGSGALDNLVTQGKIVAGSGVAVGGIAIGVAIKKGAPRPDIKTVDAFKRTLLAAKSIGYRDPATGSTSGTYTARMIEKLGIARELQPETKLYNSDGEHPENVFRALVTGETELQFGQITEIMMASGVEMLGPLPDALQQVTVLTAGLSTASKAPEAARAFIGFLAGPSAAARLKAHGFQPAVSR